MKEAHRSRPSSRQSVSHLGKQRQWRCDCGADYSALFLTSSSLGHLASVALLGVACAGAPLAAVPIGQASVIDGETLELRATRVIWLWGVDVDACRFRAESISARRNLFPKADAALAMSAEPVTAPWAATATQPAGPETEALTTPSA